MLSFSLAKYITVHVHDKHRVMTQCNLGLPVVTCQQGANPQSSGSFEIAALHSLTNSEKSQREAFFCCNMY